MPGYARNIPQAHTALKAGKWERSRWEGVELHGKTLGVVGLGRVGALVAQRALAFGMRLVAYDPYVSRDRARQMGVDLMSLEELVGVADFLTVHLPKTPDTLGIIGKELLSQAKPGLRLVNTARGGIVDEDALAEAVRSGIVAGAGLDVFAEEPVSYVNAPQLATERGVEVRETTSSAARDYVNLITLRGGEHAVAGTLAGKNSEPRIVMVDDHTTDVPPARHMLVIRNDDTPGMIGNVGTILGNGGVNISDMALGKSPTGEAALMVLAVDTPVPTDVIDELRSSPGIIRVHPVSES